MGLNKAHQGYDYQDLITSYFILKEIIAGNLNSEFSIDKKHTTGSTPDRFDDLTIFNGAQVQRKQIKYSDEDSAISLKKDYLSADSHYSLGLHRLFETWKELKTPYTEFRLCLAWEDPTDESITKVLEPQTVGHSFEDFPTKLYKVNLDCIWEESPENFNRWDSLRNYVNENNIDRREFVEFCEDLLIEVALPKASLKFNKPGDLERLLIDQARRIGIEQYPNDDVYITDFLERLAKLSGAYRTGTKQVTADVILNQLRVRTDFGRIEQKFEIDQSKNVFSEKRQSSFVDSIISNKKTLLVGEPGSGKSWFLTNLIEFLNRNNLAVIRHYCFTSTEDTYFESRVSSDVFFGNLISDIESIFPDSKKAKNQIYASNLSELNILLQHIKDPVVIIVDGLDHINRVLSNSATLSEEKTRIIEFISKIDLPPNVSLILGSQPTAEVQDLAEKHEFLKEDLPKWEKENTDKLLERFGYDDIELDGKHLSELLHEKSEGNPLYLTYILKTLGNLGSVDKVLIDSLPNYDFNLGNYYEYLTRQIENNITAEILSCLEFSVTKKELKELTPIKHHFDSHLKVLSPVLAENNSRGGIKLYHDSFKRFNIEKLTAVANLNDIYEYIINWLLEKGFYEFDKSYRYLFKYFILSTQYEKVREYASVNFLLESLHYGHSESLIMNNYRNFLYVSEELMDWPLFMYSCELYRTVATTISEDNYSQFLENFELYFEAICTIYGAERANALLFFNGDKNYSDITTAKGFRILQNFGYSPYWKEVESLFKNGIPLETFRYYMSYQINVDNDLFGLFNSLLSDNYTDYFKIFIEEVFEQRGFAEVVNCYRTVEIGDESKLVATKINLILESLNCLESIPVKSNAIENNPDPLSLDFKNDYINHHDLDRLYLNTKCYLELDRKSLIEFEKSIPSRNFFHNWIKYFIRLILIEHHADRRDIEEEVVKNIEFLASDTSPYKGKPRAVDFTHSNSELIRKTITKSLKHIKSPDAWNRVVGALNRVPFPTLSIIEDGFLNENNIQLLIDSYEGFGDLENETYSEIGEMSFKKAILYGKKNELGKARDELKKALKLITGYTFRKDTTLSEIIEPITSINRIDHDSALRYSKRLKYLSDAVMKHTEDGKGIRWLAIDWFEKMTEADYILSTKYLANELLTNEYFWKLDYMFVSYLNASRDINPIILNFLYKLSPTNNRNSYLDGFLNVISKLEDLDKNIAKQSLINLSTRNWNDSSESLDSSTELRLHQTLKRFGIDNSKIRKKQKESFIGNMNEKRDLSDTLSEFLCRDISRVRKSEDELKDYYDKKDILNENDLNALYFFLLEKNSEEYAISVLTKLITKSYPRDSQRHYAKMRALIGNVPLTDETKISLFILNFTSSRDGWFNGFVDKESLKCAIEISKDSALVALTNTLRKVLSKNFNSYHFTANLVIAFEYAGLEKDIVLSMYKQSFDFIEDRLPDESDFSWDDIDSIIDFDLSRDELAVVMILCKSKNLDAFVQREIITAIAYLIKYDAALLLKPLRWFFRNAKLFNQYIISAILELLQIVSNSQSSLIHGIKEDLKSLEAISNAYIHNVAGDILNGLKDE